MLTLLTAFACSLDADHQHFLPPRLVRAGAKLQLTFPANLTQAVFLWLSQIPDREVTVHVSLLSSNGTAFVHGQSANAGIRVIGSGATLTYSTDVVVQVWLLPPGLCLGPALLYAAPSAFTDDLRPDDHADALCVFFANSPKLRISVVSPLSALFYTESRIDLPPPARSCAPKSCDAKFRDPGFFVLENIRPSQRTTFDMRITEKVDASVPCSREFIPVLEESKTRIIELALTSGDLFSCSDLQASRETISATMAVIGIVFLGLIVLTIATLFTGCSLFGGRRFGDGRTRLSAAPAESLLDDDDL
jgi:hypothetical protein